ncbi:Proteolipid membrane potential modulator family-containing protein [Strongyloides ratti]|uniref:Proteolipid membrane potential modulator family-containing protein n=1 Tax=Strongyloides ratti TaxID=34506 RepID=A0A090KY45_STRRB|nr:Proteolipid membrane potential modulator family-containing protein [Strongyloides ratti]CEF62346.1 Proteolipid membrane potential modulator family-containing protein [Strongyloides ratti]
MTTSKCCLICLALILPPLPVAILYGCGAQFWINVLLLFLCFGIPAIIHACVVISDYQPVPVYYHGMPQAVVVRQPHHVQHYPRPYH